MLAARSSVFYAMLANQKNKEAQKDEAIIVDLKPDVVKKLLDFLYTDKVGFQTISYYPSRTVLVLAFL